jgi:hypothetical protein
MGELHRAGRYDRLADGVEQVTGRAAMTAAAILATGGLPRLGLAVKSTWISACRRSGRKGG